MGWRHTSFDDKTRLPWTQNSPKSSLFDIVWLSAGTAKRFQWIDEKMQFSATANRERQEVNTLTRIGQDPQQKGWGMKISQFGLTYSIRSQCHEYSVALWKSVRFKPRKSWVQIQARYTKDFKNLFAVSAAHRSLQDIEQIMQVLDSWWDLSVYKLLALTAV